MKIADIIILSSSFLCTMVVLLATRSERFMRWVVFKISCFKKDCLDLEKIRERSWWSKDREVVYGIPAYRLTYETLHRCKQCGSLRLHTSYSWCTERPKGAKVK